MLAAAWAAAPNSERNWGSKGRWSTRAYGRARSSRALCSSRGSGAGGCDSGSGSTRGGAWHVRRTSPVRRKGVRGGHECIECILQPVVVLEIRRPWPRGRRSNDIVNCTIHPVRPRFHGWPARARGSSLNLDFVDQGTNALHSARKGGAYLACVAVRLLPGGFCVHPISIEIRHDAGASGPCPSHPPSSGCRRGGTPCMTGRKGEALYRTDDAENRPGVMVFCDLSGRFQHPARLGVRDRPPALSLVVLVQLRLLPVAKQFSWVSIRKVINLVRVLDAQEDEIGFGAILVRAHLDPTRPARSTSMDMCDAAVERSVSGLVVHLVQRAAAVRSRAAKSVGVQTLYGRGRGLRVAGGGHALKSAVPRRHPPRTRSAFWTRQRPEGLSATVRGRLPGPTQRSHSLSSAFRRRPSQCATRHAGGCVTTMRAWARVGPAAELGTRPCLFCERVDTTKAPLRPAVPPPAVRGPDTVAGGPPSRPRGQIRGERQRRWP